MDFFDYLQKNIYKFYRSSGYIFIRIETTPPSTDGGVVSLKTNPSQKEGWGFEIGNNGQSDCQKENTSE